MSKELPYFKFFPAEWLLKDISDEKSDIQGDFIAICAHYWHKNCDITMDKLYQKYHRSKVKALVDRGFIKDNEGVVSISFLDEQWSKLSESHDKRVNAGRSGGKAKVKQSSSNATAKPKQVDIDEEVDKKEIRKDNSALFNACRDEFIEGYKTIKGQPYNFTAKDGGNLKRLLKSIKTTLSAKDLEGSDENVTDSFRAICNQASTMTWLRSNFTISNIYSQYNQIISSNGQVNTEAIVNEAINISETDNA